MTTTPDGLLLVDKPGVLTSHDVVSAVRRIVGTRKVGHAGTLDPMATGLLVLGIGKATRLLTYLVGADKTYTATIRLGQSSSTDDAEGELFAGAATGGGPATDAAALSWEAIDARVAGLRGPIQQVPSAVSAIKVDGQRAYARLRAGEEVTLQARPVTIHEFRILAVRHTNAADGLGVTDVDALVRCSSGTYIRALARDLGERLGVGGHLTVLRRTQVGDFLVDDALDLPPRGQSAPELAQPFFLSLAAALQAAFPTRVATTEEQRALSYGQKIAPNPNPGVVAVIGADGQALALVTNREGEAAPVLVFAPA